MKVILFGASGMVGQGVLRECLLDPGVELVQVVGRASLGTQHPKLRELVHPNLFEYESIAPQLTGFDACFFTLGVTSAGMKEEDYARITYDLTLAAATTLARLNPQMTFIYVSGRGTDSTEQGKSMWGRVKGRTENALLRLPFKAAYMFRPEPSSRSTASARRPRSTTPSIASRHPSSGSCGAGFPAKSPPPKRLAAPC